MSRPAAPWRPTLVSGCAGWPVLVLLLAQVALCLHFSRFALIDDAYIAFRYAQHLAGGQGLVFNPGERVEGYTCFLWVLWLAGCAELRLPLETASQWLGAACLAATLVVTARFRRPEPERPAWSLLIAPALFAANAAAAMWAVHGLETALFGLLLLLALRADARAAIAGVPGSAAGFWYALAALTRPEGALLFAASLLFWGLLLRRRLPSLVRRVLAFAVIVLPHLVWRYHYYGFLLPNTFYAKVGMGWPLVARGARYVLDFFAGPQGLLFLPVLLCLPQARADRSAAFLLWMAAAAGIVVALEGGDAFPAWRFLVPFLPVFYLLVQEGIAATLASVAPPRVPRRVAVAACFLLLAAAAPLHLWRVYQVAMIEARGADRFTRNMTLVGVALARHLPPTARIALNPVGAVPYHAGLYAYDMLGLTDLHIAHRERAPLGTGIAGHEKGDGGYILDERPELILFGNVTIAPSGPVHLSDLRWNASLTSEQEIARDPRTWQLYTTDQLPLGDGRYLLFLRRRDFAIAPLSVDPKPGSPIFRGSAREGRRP
jgi:hypothetical protein